MERPWLQTQWRLLGASDARHRLPISTSLKCKRQPVCLTTSRPALRIDIKSNHRPKRPLRAAYVSDMFERACGQDTSSGYVRGGDGQPAAIERADTDDTRRDCQPLVRGSLCTPAQTVVSATIASHRFAVVVQAARYGREVVSPPDAGVSAAEMAALR